MIAAYPWQSNKVKRNCRNQASWYIAIVRPEIAITPAYIRDASACARWKNNQEFQKKHSSISGCGDEPQGTHQSGLEEISKRA